MEATGSSFGDDVRSPEDAAPAASARRGFALRLPFIARGSRAAPAPLLRGEALAALHGGDGADDRDVSFGFLLRQSAHAIERGRLFIEASGRDIARIVAARGQAESALAGWGARLLIALFWVFIGVILAREAAAGSAARGLEPPAAAMLSRIFVAAGVLGAVAAFVGGWLIRSAEKTIGAAGNFGAEAGALMRDFAAAVAALKERIGARETPGDIARLHLVAVEAAAFLEGISFLTEPDHDRAETKFSAFLDRRAPAAGPGGGAVLLLFGTLIGAVAVAVGLPRLAASGLPFWVVVALPGLALLYALLGPVFVAVAGGAAGAAAGSARRDILSFLRRAYVEAGAPRESDLIAEVEAALAGARAPETPPQTDSAESDFAWRKAPEGPRFVAQSFAAAPPVFRTERQETFGKNFFAGRARNADPKQSPGAPDAPSRLKD